MKRKRQRSPIEQSEDKKKYQILNEKSTDKDIKQSENTKEKKLFENADKYLNLPKNKNQTENKTNIIISNTPKIPFFNFSYKKDDYNIKCEELYDSANKIFYQVRNAKILIYKTKKILFIHIYNKLILFEIVNDSYVFLSELSLKDKLGISSIEKFYLLKTDVGKNIINLAFICYNEVIVSKFDMTNYNDLIVLNREKISENHVERFYKMINENKMMFDGITLVSFFPKLKVQKLSLKYSEESCLKSIAALSRKKSIIGFCTNFQVFIYDINTNENLGEIIIPNEISSYEMGITKYINNTEEYLFILYSEKGVYVYDYLKKVMYKKLPIDTEIKTKIRKVKQFNNYIAILYNYYNLAVYDFEKNIISYKFKSNWKKSPGNEDFPILVKLSNDILLFGSEPYTVTILNMKKGEILGSVCDKENKRKCELCECIKVYDDKMKECSNDSMKEKYFFIKNSKTTLILKLS